MSLRPLHLLVAFCLVAVWAGQVAGEPEGNPCLGAGVVWRERAGYFALDGSLELPETVFGGLSEFPLQPHAPLTNSSLDCTWVLYPKPSEYSNDTTNLLRQVFVFIDVLLLGAGDSITFFSGNSTTERFRQSGPVSSAGSQVVSSDPGEALTIRFIGTSSGPKNFGAYLQGGGCLEGIQRFNQDLGWFSDGSGWAATYVNRSDCVFLIEAEGNKFVSLTVQAQLELGYDFLYVRDGSSEDAPLVALYSGQVSDVLNSTGSSLYVHFMSDKTVAYAGFNATFALFNQTACAGRATFTQPSRYFADGSGSLTYADGLDCEWWINPIHKVGEVNLYFSEFDVAPGDYVIVYAAVNGTRGKELARYSGSSPPEPVRHNGSELIIRFLTNTDGRTAQGWAVAYSSGSCLALGLAHGPRSGLVSDGSGSSNYTSSLSCSWLIDLSADPSIERIDFEFLTLDVEYRFDYVAIYDGSSTSSPMVAQYSGTSANLTGSTSQPMMLINFVTDPDTEASGWLLKYNAVDYAPTSSDNSWIAAVVAVVVVVPAVVVLGCLLFAAFALWVWYRRSRLEERLVEPDYYQLIATSTIEPLLFVSANSSLPRIKQDNTALARFTALLLDPDFAQALILGAKKSHIEVDTVRISRLIMLTYIYYAKPLSILQSLLVRELKKASSKTLFREDTALTTMFKVWSKVEAMPYLWHSFAQLVHEVRHIAAAKNKNLAMASDQDIAMTSLEVDPRRLTMDDNNLLNTLQLELVVQKMLLKLFSSSATFPRELRRFCHMLKKEIRKVFPRKAKKNYRVAVGNFLFLRLFCPALVDSFEYGLMDSPPDSATMRLLVLISKVLQGIVTGSSFREDYMQNMQAFTAQNLQSLIQYLDDIARVDENEESDKSSEEPSLHDDDDALDERNVIVRPEDLEAEFDEFDLEVGVQQNQSLEQAAKRKRSKNTSQLSHSQLTGIPEILRHNRKSLRVNRHKAASILCAFTLSVAPDVIEAIDTVLPGKKKAKALEKAFREILPLLGDKGYSTGDDTGEDSDDDRL